MNYFLRLRRDLLSARYLEFDCDSKALTLIDSSGASDTLPYATISPGGWGYVYERWVGQHLFDNGWEVVYRGLELGVRDGGLDLELKKGDSKVYAQCKLTKKKKIGKMQAEHILYEASSGLMREYSGAKMKFWLIVPSIEMAFGRKVIKGKSSFPIAEYILSKNELQDYCSLEIRELSNEHILRV